MTEQPQVTYSIAEILKGIENKFDKIDEKLEKLNTIEVKVATLTEKVEGISKRLEKVETTQDTLVKEVSDLKGVKSLITPIIVAVATALLTLLFRLVPTVS